ncbi:cbb3-type cytochrome c oxidase subunit I [uncultured Bacteroides sp.]|uniref:nitric-oxide reductase large subunit n=1 Tax=uncultured Bacteroides sp. TaxID=162156 RepID=UPI002AA66D20|nr:cbb3-type cytochrome c oxidase subunit I [uncultured Bacteroides sp.]
MKNSNENLEKPSLSYWWRKGLVIILIFEFSVLIWVTTGSYYRDSQPPIPEKVVDNSGLVVFTKADIQAGQQVFLKKALMSNGSIWGHGAYLGPDFSAQYLHNLALEARNYVAKMNINTTLSDLKPELKESLIGLTNDLLSKNRYDVKSRNLLFTEPEVKSFNDQILYWKEYFQNPSANRGLSGTLIIHKEEITQLTSFFAWAAWASAAHVPGKNNSYTNNFPYEPLIGNGPSSAAILWSALSLINLLAGIALILFFFGRFNFLGWHERKDQRPPQMMPGKPTIIERASIKFFILAILLFLFQTVAGGAMAHYFVEPGGFFGFNLSSIFSSNILRSWHLQAAILWIATAYVGGGLFLSSFLSKREPKGQVALINFLFIALVVLIAGSLLGEYLGVKDLLQNLWFWLGNQGWEYLEIGRGWQCLMAIGLVLWAFLLFRSVKPTKKEPEDREMKTLFLLAAFAIPLFYIPAFFFGSTTNFSSVDTWRFWIIHLWVEGFFEVFATVMVAIMFYKLGLVERQTAIRIIYLDAVLFLGAGILGTGHHWYWNGQTVASMAISASFSALEVVPLILLTLEASGFARLMHTKKDENGNKIDFPHKWTFYYLIAVGIWNFVGAGILGFLINLPVISYYETGTNLTPNHGHAALMGVFGMLGIAFLVFAIRQVSSFEHWKRIEKYVKISFWGLNIGLAGMVILQLFPSGVLQLLDVINNGYWHARSLEFSGQQHIVNLAWLRLPADIIFIIAGVLPLLIAVILTYFNMRKSNKTSLN